MKISETRRQSRMTRTSLANMLSKTTDSCEGRDLSAYVGFSQVHSTSSLGTNRGTSMSIVAQAL